MAAKFFCPSLLFELRLAIQLPTGGDFFGMICILPPTIEQRTKRVEHEK